MKPSKKKIRKEYTIPLAVPFYLKQELDSKYANLLELIAREVVDRIKEMRGWGAIQKEIKKCRLEIGFEVKVIQDENPH